MQDLLKCLILLKDFHFFTTAVTFYPERFGISVNPGYLVDKPASRSDKNGDYPEIMLAGKYFCYLVCPEITHCESVCPEFPNPVWFKVIYF
jgi:hypothetical protein